MNSRPWDTVGPTDRIEADRQRAVDSADYTAGTDWLYCCTCCRMVDALDNSPYCGKCAAQIEKDMEGL